MFRRGVNILTRTSRMKGWEIPPRHYNVNVKTEREIDVIIGDYLGIKNKSYPYPPFNDYTVSFHNYEKYKDYFDIINYHNDDQFQIIGEGGHLDRLWLIKMKESGTYFMEVSEHITKDKEKTYKIQVNVYGNYYESVNNNYYEMTMMCML